MSDVRGMLFQGLNETGLLTSVRRIAPQEAGTVHAAARKHAESEKLAKWQKVLPSLRAAVTKLAPSPEADVVLAEDPSRDAGAYRIPAGLLVTVVEEAWYPSEDLFIMTSDLRRCLILSHHDSILYSVR